MKLATPLRKTFSSLRVINNPAVAELRRLAKGEEHTTNFGAPAYVTKRAGSRSANSTFFIEEGLTLGRFQNKADPELTRRIIELVESRMSEKEWIQLDRTVGNSPKAGFHGRLLMNKEMARVALLWCQTLFDAPKDYSKPDKEPDILTIYWSDWLDGVPAAERAGLPEKIILVHPAKGINYILGVDYVGECKMSFLRNAMYQMKVRNGLGLHAGSKSIRVKIGQQLEDIGFLLFGLSGTGKTTLTLEDHGLKKPEGVTILQDDIVLLNRQGQAFGTENNFYVKTEGLTREGQPGLYDALLYPDSVFENVAVDPKANEVRFTDYKHGTNGRALAFRSKLPNSGNAVDLPKAHKMIFITRRDTIVPPVARLNRTQAVAFFMLGESIETSAGDPTKAGQPKHEVGFNPFIIGSEDEEGNRLLEILEANPDMEVYLLNTGSVGKGADAPGADPAGLKITKDVSSFLLQFIARQTGGAKGWNKDPEWGYEIPEQVPGIKDFARFNPRSHYTPKTYAQLTEQLKVERRKYLQQFQQLNPKVLKCI